MLKRFAVILPLAVLFGAVSLRAQQPDSGTVIVIAQEPMGPVAGALVRSGNRSAIADAEGRARLVLPAGRRALLVTRAGYEGARATVTVIADSTVSVTIDMAMAGEMVMEVEAITVTARTERLAGNTPVRVEVVDEMEVDENTLMAPSGITMLLNETPGLRVQAASPTLGTGSVRILGLPGQYTAMLADGLPIYGGAASALGPLDIERLVTFPVELPASTTPGSQRQTTRAIWCPATALTTVRTTASSSVRFGTRRYPDRCSRASDGSSGSGTSLRPYTFPPCCVRPRQKNGISPG